MHLHHFFRIIFIYFIFINRLYSQDIAFEYINPDNLFSKIKMSQKACVIQYWVPSCPSAELKLVEYSRLVDLYGESVDFYFIGLTKNINFLEGVRKHNNLHSSIYLLDTLTFGADLFDKKKNFNLEVKKYFGNKRKKDFITAYIDEKSRKYSNSLEIDEKRIKKMLKH